MKNKANVIVRTKSISMSSPEFIGDIVEYIKYMAEYKIVSVEEEASIYKLTDEECDRLGISRRKSQ